MTRICRALVAVLLIAASAVVPALLPAAPGSPRAAAANPPSRLTDTPLLLVHGWSDDCQTAFNTLDARDPGDFVGTYTLKTVDYFRGRGFHTVRTVGYYAGTWNTLDSNYQQHTVSDAAPGSCDVNVQTQASSTVAGNCRGINGWDGDFRTNDPIEHLACLMAWYLAGQPKPVNILAHSMGGLVVRAAMYYSLHAPPASDGYRFPIGALPVSRLVMVATPQAGLQGALAELYNLEEPGTEISDMTVCPNYAPTCTMSTQLDPFINGPAHLATSKVMSDLRLAGKPVGSVDTYTALIGSGMICNPSPLAAKTLLSCVTKKSYNVDPYLSADAVVQADSQMGVPADYKVFYGELEVADSNGATHTYHTGGPVYSHEGNSCQKKEWFNFLGISLTASICTSHPYYLNDAADGQAAAWVCTSLCYGGDGGAGSDPSSNGMRDLPYTGDTSSAVPVHYALDEMAALLLTPTRAQAGHAAHAGDDYPYAGLGMFNRHEGTDPWTQYYGQCDGYASWKVYENLGGAAAPGGGQAVDPTRIPLAGFTPTDASISPVVGYAGKSSKTGTWGDATDWLTAADSFQVPHDSIPQPGAIAVWTQAQTGWRFGHVGYVTDVNPDGSINVESYNIRSTGMWSELHFPANQSAVDTSFNKPGATVPWPAGFVHLGDGPGGLPALGVPNPPFHYPANTFGPNLGGNFSLAGSAYPGTSHGWYTKLGSGEVGTMDYTYTHPGASDSTATWNPPLQAGQCYHLDAFVPDIDSNTAAALYRIADARFGTSLVPVNENNYTNAFAPLGVYQARGDGTLPVTLLDNGPTGRYVAADAVRFVRQPTCAPVRNALVVDPATAGFSLAGAGTNHGWTALAGHGLLGNDLWTHTHAGTPDSIATYTATTLTPNGCYTVSAFVPDNDANSPTALYTIAGGLGTVDQNAYTNAWALIGTVRVDTGGTATVALLDSSPAGLYVGADALAFAPSACSLGIAAPVVDPGTPGFSLAGVGTNGGWGRTAGHGLRGLMWWTRTNGTSPSSTATWNPTLLPGCYHVAVFIPDTNANNPQASYFVTVAGGNGATGGEIDIDQSRWTNVWVDLTPITVHAGDTVTVTLDDTGTTGKYVAADALWFQPSTC
jgi:hypothetical protein